MKKLFLLSAVVLLVAAGMFGQTSSPGGESLEAREARIREEIKLLEAQIKYLNTIKSAAGTSNITAATSGGSTAYSAAAQASQETVALSYVALREISQTIDQQLGQVISQYRSLVIYHEPDFIALARYRLYREQVRVALANYESIVARIEEEARNNATGGAASVHRPKPFRGLNSKALVTALGVPSIATSAIKSVAELASLFRTEQTIVESKDVVDRDSLGTVVAGTFLKKYPNLIVYHPAQFVPEYDIGVDDENSLYSMVSRVNAAEAYLDYFLDQTAKLSDDQRKAASLAKLVGAVKVVKAQIRDLDFSPPTERGVPNTEGRQGNGEFRQMMRAEKLDRVLADKAGVMKLRLLSSGGARREKRNLLLGAKTDYSGSAVVEVALYDVDGTMRANEVIYYHTGFRKFKTGAKPPRL